MGNPFDFVESVSFSKKNLLNEGREESEYNPFLTNMALSYHVDSIHYANDMNMHYDIPKKAQYTYLLNSLKPRKRFSKWVKPVENETLSAIQDILQCNIRYAAEVLTLLTDEQKEDILEKYAKRKGGRENGK